MIAKFTTELTTEHAKLVDAEAARQLLADKIHNGTANDGSIELPQRGQAQASPTPSMQGDSSAGDGDSAATGDDDSSGNSITNETHMNIEERVFILEEELKKSKRENAHLKSKTCDMVAKSELVRLLEIRFPRFFF